MDTEKFFLPDEGFNFDCGALSENDLKISRQFIETTRHLREIRYLFMVFINNIENLNKKYVLTSNGNVFCGQEQAMNDDDYIAINAYIINIISAGRTLVESMECYIKYNPNLEDDKKQIYTDFYHTTYESSFAYRFLIRLRDYSQHGHLPVSSEKNNYYFDLIQIVDKPHYNHNKALKGQMKNIIDEILNKYHNTPTIALTETLVEFTVKLLSIYKMFWYQTEGELTEAYSKFQNVILYHPENIITGEDNLSGLFVYDKIDGVLHCIDPNDNAQDMFISFINEAESVYNKYEEIFREVFSENLYIRYLEEQIAVESGTEVANKVIDN